QVATLGVALPHLRRRCGLDRGDLRGLPGRRLLRGGEDPGGLTSRAVGHVLTRLGYLNVAAQDRRGNLLHGARACAAADELDPFHRDSERLDRGHAVGLPAQQALDGGPGQDRKSTRLNSSHVKISYAVFCLKKKKKQ